MQNPQTIKAIRINRNLSQRRLAELAEVAQMTICNIENGKRVSIASVRRVCAALGMTPDEVSGLNVYRPVQEHARRTGQI